MRWTPQFFGKIVKNHPCPGCSNSWLMVSIRKFDVSDLQKIQACNLMSLPENYQIKYYFYHYIAWPGISWVAETSDKKIVGYVLVKM